MSTDISVNSTIDVDGIQDSLISKNIEQKEKIILYDDIEIKKNLTEDEIKSSIELFKSSFENADMFDFLDYRNDLIRFKHINKKNFYCKACERIHTRSGIFIILSIDSEVYFCCRRYRDTHDNKSVGFQLVGSI